MIEARVVVAHSVVSASLLLVCDQPLKIRQPEAVAAAGPELHDRQHSEFDQLADAGHGVAERLAGVVDADKPISGWLFDGVHGSKYPEVSRDVPRAPQHEGL